ncbi:MAG: hypothetical protein IAE91_02550 [Ignavibacteriaceae bacterium]|nr:hypothetical protein [Ignavibacteriaceae bacterium]
MKQIIEGREIPKVQVERMLSPILGIFVEEFLTKYFESTDFAGEIKLLAYEFPLKKEFNDQSTNLDFLLFNLSKNTLIFLEVKTDVSSDNRAQLENYIYFKECITSNSGTFLFTDLTKIAKKSSKGNKYQKVLSRIEEYKRELSHCFDVKVVYLVPAALAARIKENKAIDFVLSFRDLPETINSEYNEEWQIIQEYLQLLDVPEENYVDDNFVTENISFGEKIRIVPFFKASKLTGLAKIRQQIENYISNKPALVPNYVRLGAKGDGLNPNYQVYFTNGKVIPFRNSGKLYELTSAFKEVNLQPGIAWEKFGV